ncbi:toprim domain-containing protein [Hymenobacter sp. BT175]|uniref:toprim domain-containing protein n=1 Tax=Hymenobacter translucens TaxID=2886507 RepID=UPI001D0EDFF1|nr:toprim domain-containing protein [Hymenobacter translucens]MCC2548503.1 toprim domain-containing protein [Hymenobacter translucens]
MNAPTRENDPTELDRFKRDIDLVDYAERQGYQVKKEGKRGDWHQLVKDGEVLIVTRKDDHQVYLNTGDDRDKGSIIDFAKTRGGDGHGLNLGQVRQQLREYLNDGPAPTRIYAPPVDVSRLNALPVGDPDHERQQQEDRKTRLIAEVLGVNKELTDRTYLHSRGITDSTIESPAFQGRIFTAQQNEHKNTAFPLYNEQGLASVEQKNEHYKNLLPLPKNGIWVSHPTQGKDTPVERVVVSESAIDSLSHYQLKHEQDPKNTIYIATSGTPTEAQVALIQRVIDKQEPQEVVLANDRDAGGRQFNMNYMNELHPARPLIPVADQEAYKEASRPVQWHATSDKYHTALKVSYHHESAESGAAQVQQLTDRVAKMNGTGEAGPTIELEVQRSTERETVLRLSVAKADTAQLEVISQELYRQREQLRPEQERSQEAFIRVDYPQAKDWNRDLELTAQGMNAEQIRAQAALDEQQRAAEREQRRQQEDQQRQAEYARSTAMERDEQETRRQYDEAQKQRARDNTPEAQKERQQEDQRFNQAVMGAAVADAGSPDDGRPFRSYRSEQEAAEQTAQFVHAKDAGLVLLKEYINDNPPPTGRKVDEAEQEELRSRARYAEPAAAINLPIGPPAEEKTATWKIDEVAANTTGRAEAWKEVLDNSGYSMRTSEVRSTVDEQGIRRAEFDMTYRNDQPDIAIIHAIVTNTNARAEAGNEKYAGVSVAESEPDRAARQAAAEAATIQPHNRDRSQDVADKPSEVQLSSTPEAVSAEAQQPERSFTAAPIYVNAVPTAEGQINSRDTSPQAASYSLYQIQVDAHNPDRAVLLPAPGADPQLLNGYHTVMQPAYNLSGAPKQGDAYVAVSSPTQLERTEEGWRIAQRGQAGFSPTPAPGLNTGQERSTVPTPSEKEAANVSAQGKGSEKQVIIKVDEPPIKAGERGQAEAVKAAITSSGAKVGDIQSTTDEQGIRHSEMKVSYRTEQPELNRISQTLDAVANQKGSQVIEHSSDRAERKDISRGQEISLKRTRTAEITR